MTTISILRDQVQRTRTDLCNAAAVKASKRKFKLTKTLDLVTQGKEPTDPQELAEHNLIIEFLDKDYHRKYVDWRNNVELLNREEKRGWS